MPIEVEQARLHTERYHISEEAAAAIRSARRVVAVGTTSVRTIESAWQSGRLEGETDIFIYPGYAFRAVGAMLTNFHLPRTSLLLLVCAFAGTELALAAYRHAVEQKIPFLLVWGLHAGGIEPRGGSNLALEPFFCAAATLQESHLRRDRCAYPGSCHGRQYSHFFGC